MTSEPTQQASHMATVSSPSVINHVMHASYGEVRFANTSVCVLLPLIQPFLVNYFVFLQFSEVIVLLLFTC